MNQIQPPAISDGAANSGGRISVVIPTKDAAQLLPDCLASVAWADEIIVVDMFSQDRTGEICQNYPQCQLIQRNDYIFGNVNFGIDLAKSEWIMRLDADERITPELAGEIRGILSQPPPPHIVGFEFWERPIILGKELRFGFGRRHYRKMMFRRGRARHNVEKEHEEIQSEGTWLRAGAGYLHYNYSSVGQYLTKMNYYTDRDIERMPALTAKPPAVAGILEPARAFYLHYFKYQGFRDGYVGFVDASMRSIYQFVMWAKIREQWPSR